MLEVVNKILPSIFTPDIYVGIIEEREVCRHTPRQV